MQENSILSELSNNGGLKVIALYKKRCTYKERVRGEFKEIAA